LWRQYGLADTRYWGDNAFIFGVEFAAVIAGAIVFCGWVRLIRTDVSDEVRVRSLWLGVFPLLVLYAIHLQVDFLTRRMGAREGLTETVR
jgi:hypothetical protein